MAIIDWRTTPSIAVNDPVLMLGMPKGLTAATGMDALTHAVEAYVSVASTPVTDACALQAVRLVAGFLRRAVATPDDIEARDMMRRGGAPSARGRVAGCRLLAGAGCGGPPWCGRAAPSLRAPPLPPALRRKRCASLDVAAGCCPARLAPPPSPGRRTGTSSS